MCPLPWKVGVHRRNGAFPFATVSQDLMQSRHTETPYTCNKWRSTLNIWKDKKKQEDTGRVVRRKKLGKRVK